MPPSSTPRRRLRPGAGAALAGALLGGLGLAAAALLFMSLPGFEQALTNADTLFLPDIADDLLHRLAYVGGWQLPPAPRFFPDLPMLVAIEAVTGDFRRTILLNGVLQLVLLGHAGYLVWHRIAGVPLLAYQACFLTVLGALVGLGWLVAGGVVEAWYGAALLPAYHMGALLGLLWSLAAALKAAAHPSRGSRRLLVALVLLCGVSDLFYLVQFAIPYVATVALLAWAQRRRPLLTREACAVIAAGLVAFVAGLVLAPMAGGYLLYWLNGVLGAALVFVAVLWRGDGAERALSLALFGLAATVALRALRLRRATAPDEAGTRFLAVFICLSIAITLATVTVFSLARDDGTLRYLLPLALLPAIWLAGEAARLMAAALRRGAVLAAAAALPALALALLAWRLLPPGQDTAEDRVARWMPAPAALACFPGTERRFGLAPYAAARPLTLFSGGRVQVAQLTARGTPLWWMTDRWWFLRDRLHPESPARYGFILIGDLDPAVVTARYGAPDRVERCAAGTVWHYPPERLTPRVEAAYDAEGIAR